MPDTPSIEQLPAGVIVRAARISEADELSDLCMRSKAMHGYDAAFMAMCRPALTVTAGAIEDGRVWAAECGGTIAGVVAVEMHADGVTAELDKIFVAPGLVRGGVGARLMEQARMAAVRLGARRMMILADPNAAGFYERCGAVHVGEAPSDAVPGRTLPRYELRLT